MSSKARWLLVMIYVGSALALATAVQEQKGVQPEAGLKTGEAAPAFTAHDQNGTQRASASLAGKNGTVLLFFRSADW
jgi:cytochrome oxidase Cu insertion factor (SCO1/SenC/PrrC family)